MQELAGKLAKGSENQFKVFTPVSTADFDENYMAINASYPGSSPGHWTVRDGDTLQSIASALWGDATLWYILADANGLQGTDSLRGGEVLTVPNRVTNIHNTATTFKPYDPGKAIGNTQPTLPDPPPPPSAQNGCGTFMSVIAIVVAVVVTIYTAGAAASAMSAGLASTAGGTAAAGTVAAGTATAAGASTWSLGVAAMSGGLSGGMAGAGAVAAAAGAAAGSVASQAVLMAGGQQKGFDWRQVGLSAATGGLAGGIAGPTTSVLGSGTGAAFTVGAMRGVATQGLGILVGAQTSFDWKGVAASTIAWGVGTAVGNTGLGKVPVAGQAASNMAAGIMGTLVRGGSVERNLGSIALDAMAATVGNMVAQQVAAQSVSGKADYTRQAIDGMNGEILPAGLGGVGSGFVAPETTYSGNTALFGVYGGLVDSSQIAAANSIDAKAASLSITPDDARRLLAADNSPSIVGLSLNGPGVKVEAVPYPQIAVTPLSGAGVMAAAGAGETALDAFVRGARGGYAGVLDPSPSAAYAGNLLNDAAQNFKQFGYQMIGAQSADEARAAWNAGNYGLATAKEAQAFVEAGLAFTGIGELAQPAAMAARRFAGSFTEVADNIVGNYVDNTGLRFAVADTNGPAASSSRLSYMGGTPDKYSRTGLEVVERMRGEGLIVGDGPLLRGNPNNLQLVGSGGALARIDANVDMAHRVDAVTWWNDVGRFYGPKSPEVRQFMLNPDNYVLQPSSINRSAGARLGQTYQPPVPPDFTNLKR
ncbi:LysM peptidoglycan-binding domain-containing protein [Paraburkholderia sp. J10-1]|uniref:LysM peptidoglycan-binding domain-containing protein n=1 Tax=Paraburkholderia sp. J10-1 TaxID=2805430 RepID=UPI002AB65E45|nr:GH-E family nuclease [Paraburkholderia sp. J10-1]